MEPVSSQTPALEARGICKQFGPALANGNVSITLAYGRIHALLGENGAGKSTLLSILYGLHSPDSGQIRIRGRGVAIRHPRDAIRHGIGLVQQHFSLIPAFSVLDNILLGGESLFIDKQKAAQSIHERLQQFGLELPLNQPVRDLPVGVQQQVEIGKVLCRNPRILLFDEPTAALVSSEIDTFLDILVRLRGQGIAVVLITHRLPEVMRVADEITVLRKGQVVLQGEISDTPADRIAEAIVGERLPEERYQLPEPGNPVLVAEKACFSSSRQFDPLCMEIREGEILGVAGVAGNGQEEIIDGLLGLNSLKSGTLTLREEDISHCSLAERKRKGIAFIPQDRIRQALLPRHSIYENYCLNRMTLPGADRITIQRGAVAERVRDCIETYRIQTPSMEIPAGNLSGGHQQRLVISRELMARPKVIIAHAPTRGLDLRATRFVHEHLIEQCRAGAAVILFSSEWLNLFLLCKRIAVLYRGAMVEIRDTHHWTAQELGRRMVGLQDTKDA